MKSLMKTAALSLLTLASAMNAMGQAEVNPDHFPDEATTPVRADVQAEIEQQRALVQAYEAQLRMKADIVEQSRNEAISAGMQGDGAGAFIDAYRANQKQYDQLRASLNPQIAMALSTIASLEAGSSVVAQDSRARGTTNASAPLLLSRASRREYTRSKL